MSVRFWRSCNEPDDFARYFHHKFANLNSLQKCSQELDLSFNKMGNAAWHGKQIHGGFRLWCTPCLRLEQRISFTYSPRKGIHLCRTVENARPGEEKIERER